MENAVFANARIKAHYRTERTNRTTRFSFAQTKIIHPNTLKAHTLHRFDRRTKTPHTIPLPVYAQSAEQERGRVRARRVNEEFSCWASCFHLCTRHRSRRTERNFQMVYTHSAHFVCWLVLFAFRVYRINIVGVVTWFAWMVLLRCCCCV